MLSEPAPLFVTELDGLTNRVRAYRTAKIMGRLTDKLARATNAVDDVERAVDRDIEALIERTKVVHTKREEAFHAHHVRLDQHMVDLSGFAEELDAFGKNSSGAGENSGSAYDGVNKPDP